MDVARPYRAIVPSLEGSVLTVLSRTTHPLTGREISRLAKTGSNTGIHAALVRLAEEGTIDYVQAGSAILYTLNREHIAAPLAEALGALFQQLLDRIRGEIDTWQVKPIHASMFGSAARGDGDAKSDIDILLVRPSKIQREDPAWEAQTDGLRHHVGRWTGNHAAIVDTSPRDLGAAEGRGEEVLDNVAKDSITLYGKDFKAYRKMHLR